MKKILSLLLVLTMVLVAFAACGPQNDGNTPETPVEKDYKLSIGLCVTENLNKLKLTETVATIVIDADGKIVLCRLDAVDYTAKYNEDGTLDTTAPTTKVALGDSYGAMPAGTWAQQGAALEKYVIGKTQDEVAAIARDNDGKATDADLVASCSIAIPDLLKAIDNAFKCEHKISFKTAATDLKVGLSMGATVKDSSKDEAKNAKFSADYAAAVMAEGKVIAAILDSAECEFKSINAEGIAAEIGYGGTKRWQGDNYGAMPAGTWYVQADAYAKAAIGKTADDIATLASEGVAGCTIYAGGYKAVIETAVKTAR